MRKKRLDLELLQRDLATQLGVSTATVINWERDHTEPGPRYLPHIIQFLGYVPYEPEMSTCDRLPYIRSCLGYSQEAYARKIGVDPGTLRKWERGIAQPNKGYTKEMNNLRVILSESIKEGDH